MSAESEDASLIDLSAIGDNDLLHVLAMVTSQLRAAGHEWNAG